MSIQFVPFKKHFRQYYWCYLLVLALSITLWSWLVPAKVALKKSEKVGIFVGAKSVDETSIQSKVMKDADSTMLACDIYSYSPSESKFGTIVSSSGKESCDFFLLSPQTVDINVIMTLCLALPSSSWDNEFSSSNKRFIYEGSVYGFYLPSSFGDYLSFEDETYSDYCFFINRESKNFGSFYSPNQNSESGHALKAIHSLLGDKL